MLMFLFLSVLFQPATSLDYDVFKAKVEPLLTEKRPGHARCITCHSTGTAFRLVRLPAGRTAYTDEESRKNFEAVTPQDVHKLARELYTRPQTLVQVGPPGA